MGLRIFNTRSRSIEDFVTCDPGGERVRMYCCGPTVHDYAHIGNFRTFVLGDLLRRYLEFRGYQVLHVMNITDVEDKIIARVKESRDGLRAYTMRFERAFIEDMEALGCVAPHHMPRATAHMEDITRLIGKLMDRGLAYQAADRSVYFSIQRYRERGGRYGQLVRLNFDAMRPGRRVSQDDYAKDTLADFALWKARTPADGNVYWPSPWGEGRPGWHIECSAMSMSLLGTAFDLHLGGEDLIFPHHEDEIAQSEGAGEQEAGQRFVRYWVHGAHLLVEGKKMSKSLGNFFTLRDLLERGYTGREVRFVLLSAHYRETFNLTEDGLRASRTALKRLDECLGKLRERAQGEEETGADTGLVEAFTSALDHDLNISAGWGVVFDWVREVNRLMASGALSSARANLLLSAWRRVDAVLGVGGVEHHQHPAEVERLLAERQEAREHRDFNRADAIRGLLKSRGWLIEDTDGGSRLKHI